MSLTSHRPALRPLAVALAASALIAGCGGSGNDTPAGQPLELRILHINDHHSTLESKSKTLQLDAGTGKAEAVAVDAAGFARVTQALSLIHI